MAVRRLFVVPLMPAVADMTAVSRGGYLVIASPAFFTTSLGVA
jgi:hypothetical protein